MRLMIALLLFPLSVNADWLQSTANVLIAADWMQTREIASNPKYIETNRILGENPSIGRVDAYFLSSTIAVNVIGENLTDYRQAWYGTVIITQLAFIAHNRKIGVTVGF